MTPQKITVKIPRKQGEMIPFNLELWNTGEYEVVDSEHRVVRVICTDNGDKYPIIIIHSDGCISSFTLDGRCNIQQINPSLFLCEKSSEELPNDLFMNVYESGVGDKRINLEEVNKNASDTRLAIIHISYQWEYEQ